MTRGTFTTALAWEVGEDEIEADVMVVYSRTRGYPATMIDPACDAEIEIISITPKDPAIIVPESFYTDDDLIAECFTDWEAEIEDAQEWRAQLRRDDLLMRSLGYEA